ncbi:hypothetical protein WICPIJ_006070 [Wickerhamomyces pijperi]|uniref:Uncharacterized protein n=1 Tax=Wickerhamomyces pijperi TaxID=599730 RepID=A0A9P8Q4Q2_WICPI|nr:hypothetical protein WICPIJ_006070 [Wickerhamomyces pijperi]
MVFVFSLYHLPIFLMELEMIFFEPDSFDLMESLSAESVPSLRTKSPFDKNCSVEVWETASDFLDLILKLLREDFCEKDCEILDLMELVSSSLGGFLEGDDPDSAVLVGSTSAIFVGLASS